MSSHKTKSGRDLGLEFAARCGKHFLKLEHLHYGYWADGLDVDIANLYKAQQNYTGFLVSHIPEGVKTILDVGCGTGHIAKELINKGYVVDCVSPSSFLSEQASSLLGETTRIFKCPYEKLETSSRYDLVLFSESFQYVNMEKGLEQTVRFLNDEGILLICDVFKTEVKGNAILGGGHRLGKFHRLIEQYPFELVLEEDITEETAPNIDILDDALKNVIAPVLNSSLAFLGGRYPLTVKFMRWKYRKKIDKISAKYFSEGRSSEEFKICKTYRLFLYRKICTSRSV
jgi:SAM-dependent methyltransferase